MRRGFGRVEHDLVILLRRPLSLSECARTWCSRMRTLTRMKVMAQRRLAAFRKLAEKNEEAAAEADEIDIADSEAVEAVS